MKTRKQKSLFRKSLNKIYSYAIVTLNDDVKINNALREFFENRKTFKAGIKPIKKLHKFYHAR